MLIFIWTMDSTYIFDTDMRPVLEQCLPASAKQARLSTPVRNEKLNRATQIALG